MRTTDLGEQHPHSAMEVVLPLLNSNKDGTKRQKNVTITTYKTYVVIVTFFFIMLRGGPSYWASRAVAQGLGHQGGLVVFTTKKKS